MYTYIHICYMYVSQSIYKYISLSCVIPTEIFPKNIFTAQSFTKKRPISFIRRGSNIYIYIYIYIYIQYILYTYMYTASAGRLFFLSNLMECDCITKFSLVLFPFVLRIYKLYIYIMFGYITILLRLRFKN